MNLKTQKTEMKTEIKPRPIRPGDNVVSDEATQDQGKVKLGDGAPVFGR